MEVDKAGTRNIDLVYLVAAGELFDDSLRNVARLAACRLCKPHRNVAREVAMFRIASSLDR